MDTEPPFTGKLLYNKEKGTYLCAKCAKPLFASDKKYDSHSGWPSFWDALPGAVVLKDDDSHGMHRSEAVCKNCGSHLGHLFDDGPQPTGMRYCINSFAMDFEKAKDPT